MMMSMMPMMMPMMVLNAMTGASGSGRNKRKRSTDDLVPALGTGEGPVSRLTFVRASVVAAPDQTAEDGQVDQDEIDLDEQCAKAMQVDFNDLLPFSAFGRSHFQINMFLFLPKNINIYYYFIECMPIFKQSRLTSGVAAALLSLKRLAITQRSGSGMTLHRGAVSGLLGQWFWAWHFLTCRTVAFQLKARSWKLRSGFSSTIMTWEVVLMSCLTLWSFVLGGQISVENCFAKAGKDVHLTYGFHRCMTCVPNGGCEHSLTAYLPPKTGRSIGLEQNAVHVFHFVKVWLRGILKTTFMETPIELVFVMATFKLKLLDFACSSQWCCHASRSWSNRLEVACLMCQCWGTYSVGLVWSRLWLTWVASQGHQSSHFKSGIRPTL